MRILSLFLFASIAACAAPDESTTEQNTEGGYCNAPLYAYCDPRVADTCTAKCNGVLAYCKDYPSTLYNYCVSHPGSSTCSADTGEPCDWLGYPCGMSRCVYGSPALTGGEE